MSDNQDKEETLASFQIITGIDDVGEAFSHLEASNWDLVEAISRVMPHEDAPLAIHTPEPPAPDPVAVASAQPDPNNTNGFGPFNFDELPGPSQGARMFPSEYFEAQLE
ncbi:GH19822 [Drosophila grimshawi]|uniref:GH19822 n=1 Tax=Drosophila grimshawi TaxID=7222 RepID=B4J9X4_DROGR|nr:GH19822 [Drosophila grimshawi]